MPGRQVLDFTGGNYGVLDIVQEFVAAGIPLSYRQISKMPCRKANAVAGNNDIVVCLKTLADDVLGVTTFRRKSTTVIKLDPSTYTNKNTICHELMHATIKIGECYDCYPNTSCVWGDLQHLGSTDIANIQRFTGRKSNKKPKYQR